MALQGLRDAAQIARRIDHTGIGTHQNAVLAACAQIDRSFNPRRLQARGIFDRVDIGTPIGQSEYNILCLILNSTGIIDYIWSLPFWKSTHQRTQQSSIASSSFRSGTTARRPS